MQDILFSKHGATLAFILATSALDDPLSARIDRAARSFQRLLVLVPHAMLDVPAALATLSTKSAVVLNSSFAVMPIGASFTQQALAHACAALEAAAQEDAWHQAQLRRVQRSDAAAHALAALPGMGSGGGPEEALHRARLLRTLGSVAHLASLPPSTLSAGAGLAAQQAASLAEFFNGVPVTRRNA